jgi:nitroimidazol reductase NimA-like FMN-containing flavoprotein (pyridoxamine 5'-phosphate oxidase superfamily)
MSTEPESSSASSPLSATERTRLRRYPDRARTDRAELYSVLDGGLLCYLGAVVEGCPRVIPMVYGRIDDTLYLHGSVANQALVAAKNGGELCVTVLEISGLVLANSLFHHSINFRCAMIYGPGRLVTDETERLAGLRAAANQLVPGRAATLPDPTRKQLAATMVIALSLAEASVKVRDGWPNGDPSDYERDIWAGVLPLTQTWGEPRSDPKLRQPFEVPPHVARLVGQPLGGPNRSEKATG